MKQHAWLLIERLEGWQVCKVGTEKDNWSSAVSSAQAVKSELDNLSYQDGPVVVGLHANRCVSGTFQIDDDTQNRPSNELLYDFEQVVPFSAEELTAQFVFGNGQVFGVGIPVAELRPFLEELQDSGVNIESVAPSTMLAAQAIGTFDQDKFIVLDSDCLELLLLTPAGICQWQKLPTDEAQAVQSLKLAGAVNEETALLISNHGSHSSHAQSLGQHLSITPHQDSYDELVVDASRRIATGELPNNYELNQSSLLSTDKLRRLRPAIHFALGSLSLGLLLIMASLGWKIQTYSALRQDHRKAQEKAYSQLHTGAIPQSIELRLISQWKRNQQQTELAKLAGPSQGRSAMATLHLVLTSFKNASKTNSRPKPLHFRVTAMNFDADGQASLYVDFPDRSDAEAVRQQLIAEGFKIKAFPTRVRNGRVIVDAVIQLSPKQPKST